MGFFDILNSVDHNSNDDLEERMHDLELEDWQKDLVREGKYDPENFEESEDLEEDEFDIDEF